MNDKPLNKADVTHRSVTDCARPIREGFRLMIEGDRVFLNRDADCNSRQSLELQSKQPN